MNKYFFIKNEYITKFVISFILLCLFGLYKIALFLFLIFVFILFFMRKRNFFISDLRLAEPDLVLSPISGVLLHLSKRDNFTKLVFRIYFYNCSGIYLPMNGEVVNTSTNKAELVNKRGLEFAISTKSLFSKKNDVFLVIPGDRGVVGGLVGHLPLGGKVTLEIPSHCEVMIKKGDRVLSSRTIIAKISDELRKHS